MRLPLIGAAILAVSAAAPCFAHGGRYIGPGDTVPPPGGGGGGNGAAPPPVNGPAPPGSTGGGNPGVPQPGSGGQRPGQPGGNAPVSGGGDLPPDLSVWEFWWELNKEPYLNLRATVQSGSVLTGSSDIYLGRGTELKAQRTLRPTPEQIRGEVVPALLWVLENEEQNDLLTGAMIALAKIGDVRDADGRSQFVEVLTPFLASPEQEVAETAALALGILADVRAVPTLASLMRGDRDGVKLTRGPVAFRTRSFAAYGLGLAAYDAPTNADRRSIARTLVEFLQQPDEARPDIKVGALQALGLTRIDWTDSDAPEAADDPIAAFVADRAALLAYLERRMDPVRRGPDAGFDDHRVRAQTPIAAARLLGTTRDMPAGDRDALEVRRAIAGRLLALSQNRQERVEVRQSATIALGMIGDAAADALNERIFQSLAKAAKSSADPQTEFFALMAIAQMGSRPGVGDAPRALQDEAEQILMRALANGKGQKAPWAALALGVYGNALLENDGTVGLGVRAALRERLERRKSTAERGAYAIALGLLEDRASQGLILDTLESIGSGQDGVRGHLCVALGLMGATNANDTLTTLVRTSKFRDSLLKSAAIGLGLLGDKETVPELIEMLKGAKGLSSQASIATALGTIGDTNAVSTLVEMVRDESDEQLTDTARGFACAALGITCDKEFLPWNTKIAVNTNYRANVRTLTNPAAGDGILDIL